MKFATEQFEQIWIAESSTLEALFGKLDSLQDKPVGTLAGKMASVVDLVTRLPVPIWFEENPRASDTHFETDLLRVLSAKTLLIIDRGFYHFQFWAQLIEAEVDFICPLKAGASYMVEQVFTHGQQVKDQLIVLGIKRKNAPQRRLRLVQVRFGSTWYIILLLSLTPNTYRLLLSPTSTVAVGGLKKRLTLSSDCWDYRIFGQVHSIASSCKFGLLGCSMPWWWI